MKLAQSLAVSLAERAGFNYGVRSALRIIASNQRNRKRRVTWLSELTGFPLGRVASAIAEIERDPKLLGEVQAGYRQRIWYTPTPLDIMVDSLGQSMFFHQVSQYVVVRLLRPAIVVETGGTPGKSSAFLLQAMEKNGFGLLYTIDLAPPPSTDGSIRYRHAHVTRPRDTGSNWVVPDRLRSRQRLFLGDSRILLPKVLAGLGKVDMFIHDSDHSYGHMTWEFSTAFPHVRSGGIIWSDDILAHTAWIDFCVANSLRRMDFLSQGGTRRP